MVKYPSTPWPRGQSVVSSTQGGISLDYGSIKVPRRNTVPR
uniref:Uncharacterized protein n=1 Tax=Anguilla anguilla TaxID=7936 RepID=A0A0E9TIV2_ANGAN